MCHPDADPPQDFLGVYPDLVSWETPEELEKLFADSGGRAGDERQQLDEDLPCADGIIVGLG